MRTIGLGVACRQRIIGGPRIQIKMLACFALNKLKLLTNVINEVSCFDYILKVIRVAKWTTNFLYWNNFGCRLW